MKKWLWIIIPVAVLLIGVVTLLVIVTERNKDRTLETPFVAPVTLPESSAWVAYWDLDESFGSIETWKESLAGISLFAAYFGEDDVLILPDALDQYHSKLKETYASESWEYYLTIVNDRVTEQSSSLKDKALLTRLLADDKSMDAHIDRLMELASSGKYDGIEIDYEAIRSNMSLWESFVRFCGRLYSKTEAAGLKLRVILEPGAPLDELDFPVGPEYVMMCYNLYGSDKATGPKADDAFMREMIDKMKLLPGKSSFALATGGYHWVSGARSGKQIETEDAIALAEANNASIYRSEKSGALTFQFYDENHKENTVWFADNDTLRHWAEIVSADGDHGIMIWRAE